MGYLYASISDIIFLKMNKENTTEYRKMINRLNRIEGQIRALKSFLSDENKTDCKEFITQVKAARNALKSLSKEYITRHIHTCQNHSKKIRDKEISDAINLLIDD